MSSNKYRNKTTAVILYSQKHKLHTVLTQKTRGRSKIIGIVSALIQFKTSAFLKPFC